MIGFGKVNDFKKERTGGQWYLQGACGFSQEKLEAFKNVMISKDLSIDLPLARWRGLALRDGTASNLV